MDCGGVFVKYVLFIFNMLFVTCGILLIVFGSIMVSKMHGFTNFDEAFTANSVAITILVLGCFIFLVAFMGCCGAIREDTCCMTTYSIIMLGLFLGQIALIVFVWIKRPDILNYINQVELKIWQQHTTDQTVMDVLQKSFTCCGYNSSSDYPITAIPASCCDAPSNGFCDAAQAKNREGCKGKFANFWSININIIKYAGLGVAAVELVAFIFSCCLANQVRNSSRRQHY